MDCPNYITLEPERKPGQHLQREDRGAIQRLRRLGYSNRAIARELNCSPSTVGNELLRGTPPRKSNKGRVPGYFAKRGQAVYRSNRSRINKRPKGLSIEERPDEVAARTVPGYWEADTVVGLRNGKEAVVFTLVERMTDNYIAM